MDTIVRADLGDFVILIIMVVFGIISQVAGAAAKKKQQQQRRRNLGAQDDEQLPDTDRPIDALNEFLRRVSGEEERSDLFQSDFLIKTDTQVVEEESRPQPVVRPMPIAPQSMPERKDQVRPRPPSKPPVLKPIPAPLEPVKPEAHPKMSAFRSGVPAFKLPSIPAMNLRIDSPSYTEASKGKQGIGSEMNLSDRKKLRRAMLSHIIFSPPKALERQP